MRPYFLRQPRGCFGGSRQDDNTGGRSVQPVHESKEDIAWFSVLLLDPSLAFIQEGPASRLVALHELAVGFVNDQQVIVFVDEVHIQSSWMSDSQYTGW